MKKILLFLVFIPLCSCYKQDSIKYFIANEDSYDDKELRAFVNEKEFTLISMDEMICFKMEKIADFNNDGYEDLLATISPGCGGTCCADSYQIFSYDGVKFQKTERIGYSWNGIEISESSVGYNFVVETVYEGFGNTEMCQDKVETFTLKKHQFELIHTIADHKLEAIAELESEDFIGKEEEELVLLYDLDNDGLKDTLKAKYWSRYGRLYDWGIEFGNGVVYKEKDATPKRIGVLSSKTNGVYDIVVGCDAVLKWNGKNYEY